MVKAYLSLGSNIGDRVGQLESAIRVLNDKRGIKVTNVSPIYETEPVGYVDQDDFLNLCIEIETDLSPHALLRDCLDTEQQLHRVRKVRWGPRTCDIDILLYGSNRVDAPDLTIPHPRMLERAFVLVPLIDIASQVVEPQTNQRIGDLQVPDDRVKKYKD